MKFKSILAAAALSSMAVSPVMAQASADRASTPVQTDAEEAFGGNEFINAIIIVAIAAIGMIVLEASDDDPVSP